MKKFVLSMLIGFVGTSSLAMAGNVGVETMGQAYGACIPSQSKDINYYIPNDSVTYQPTDELSLRNPAILVASKTKVQLWNPAGIISGCDDWYALSNVVPGNNISALFLKNSNGCTFTKPSYTKSDNPDRLDAQIHYALRYWTINPNAKNTLTASFSYTTVDGYRANPKRYTCYPSGKVVDQPALCPKATVNYQIVSDWAEKHDGECLNYRVFRCGDGLLNGRNGSANYTNGTAVEKCDPKDPNKTGWGNGGCSATCEPITKTLTPPQCNSQYNGQTVENLVMGNHLCNPGTATEFAFNEATNTWTWKCNGEAGTTPVACSAKKAPKKIYDLALTKDLSNETKGPFEPGSPVKFEITVTNQGNQTANTFTVTDYLPPALELTDSTWAYDASTRGVSKTINQPLLPGQSVKLTIATRIKADFTGDRIVNLAEITMDDGDDIDSTPKNCDPQGKENEKECTSNEDDNDREEVPLTRYDLALTKKIMNKKSAYALGETLDFAITVINQGNKIAKNIEITDYLPEGLELVGDDWKLVNGKAARLITETIAPGASKVLVMQVRIKPDFKGTSIKNFAEISKDNSGDYNTKDKDSTPDQNPDNDCYVAGKHLTTGNGKSGGACGDPTDEDDHDGDELTIIAPNYDLALTKKIMNKKSAYALGETLDFAITAINQGNKIARNIEITDYLPAGLELTDNNWTLNGDKATRMLTNEIAPGAEFTVTMRVKIRPDFKGKSIRNFAEISKDNSGDYNTTDKDSTPDQNPNNDCHIIGKHLINGNGKSASSATCNDETDEDDHDSDELVIRVNPDIKKDLLGDPNKLYKPGDLVGFKMPFGNPGTTKITRVSVKDLLPLNLEYVSSELHGVQGAELKTYKTGGVDVVEYAYFDLDAGQEGYMLLTGRVKETNLDERTNTVVLLENDIKVDHDTEPYKLHEKKLAIEKSVDMKTVAAGDIVTYTIKVSVLTGSFDTLVVSDLLPRDLQYQENSYKILNATAEHQVSNFQTGATAEKRENLTWTLVFPKKITKGQSFQIQLKAKFVGTSTGVYTNTACVKDPNTPSESPLCDDEDITPKPPKDSLKIKKYVNKTLAEAGREDEVMTGFAMGQTGFFTLEVRDTTTSLTGFTVVDVVEGNLEYLDSRDLLNNAFTGVYLRDAKNTDTYKYTTTLTTEDLGNKRTRLTWKVEITEGFFLPGDRYIMQFKTKVNGDQKNIGVVTFSTPNTPNGRDEDPATVKPGDVKLTIQKEVAQKLTDTFVDKISLNSNAEAFFKLTISGANAPLTGFRVEDTLEDSKLLFLEDSLKLENNAFTGVITFKNPMGTNPEYTITPTVVKDATTKTTKLTWQVVMKNWHFMPGDTMIIFFKVKKVSSSTEKNIAKVCYPTPSQNEKCEQDPAEIIPPGWSTGWGGCTHNCWGGGGGFTPSCGDWYKQGNEICDWKGAQKIGSDWKLFAYDNIFDTKYAGYTCNANCRLEYNGEKVAPKCFNIQNGSISIMKGEVLPFFWNMEAQLGRVEPKERLDWFKNNYTLNESTADIKEKIDLSSMECLFRVYAPGQQKEKKSSYSFWTKCVNVDGWADATRGTYPAIQDWINQNKQGWFGGSELTNHGLMKNVFDSLDNQDEYPILLPLSSKLYIKNFGTSDYLNNGTRTVWTSNGGLLGEYKLALEEVRYDLISKDEKGKVLKSSKTFDERVCEVDFAVTEPYLIQRSPYGAINADSPLSRYMTIGGDQTFNSAFDKQVKASDYAVPQNMANLFNTFKNKYQRLAKSLNGDLLKVPGKAIYLYAGEWKIDLTSLFKKGYPKTPFTFIATKGQNIEIKWTLKTNAMIMTAGEILVNALASCNENIYGNDKYGHAGQLLQGIFYAGGGFKSINDGHLKNTANNLDKSEWCNYGNLHIKGVAIGNLQNLVDNRRSELYTWFKWENGGKDPKEKKDIIINGASVLVDYNPSLRGQLPPGAEEFNKALAVYRK